ncbi:MAG: hypothetical protein GKS00_02940 [Alphaproteobacteria bacterium]|nr:hypothetical protein [Alphaproteobacteria bacterium]
MTDRPVIVLGVGGHAAVVFDLLHIVGKTVKGALVRIGAGLESPLSNLAVLGDDSALSEYMPVDVNIANGIGATRNTEARRSAFSNAQALGFDFPALVHPSAIVAENVELGPGVQVMAGAIIQTGARIKANTIVNTGAQIDHDCLVGPHCHISPGAVLSGAIVIEANVIIGTGARLIQEVKVGADSHVGAGATVTGHIPKCSVVRAPQSTVRPASERSK